MKRSCDSPHTLVWAKASRRACALLLALAVVGLGPLAARFVWPGAHSTFGIVARLGVAPAHAQGGTTPTVSPAIEGDPWTIAAVASADIDSSRFERARLALQRLAAEAPEHPATLFTLGKLRFHEGQYEEAVTALEAAAELAPNAGAIGSLLALAQSTQRVVSEYAVHTTPDGLFDIRYDARRDEVLIPWAAETLEAAYYEIGYDLGYWPEPPIRVEIHPRASTLAQVSSLTEEAIETSGTIALCKYNKLMFTSPRATLRGYGWRTTLAHEYVHYVIEHKVQASLPIWFHEAAAKYLEGRWTGERDMEMPPSREELLSERIEADNLITFEQMHPSMAYLPSPEDASTAYAQVFTVVEYLIDRRGPTVLRSLLERVRDGADIIAAIEGELEEPFGVFEQNWLRYLIARPRVDIPGQFADEVQLVAEDADDENTDAFAGVESPDAQEFLRLGELLRARGFVAGAVEEYQKAELLLGRANPLLQNAMARANLDLARAQVALTALEEVVDWFPSFYLSHLHRGEALNALGEYEAAIVSLELAGGINPFDPAVHQQLAIAWDALGNGERAEHYRHNATQVAGGT